MLCVTYIKKLTVIISGWRDNRWLIFYFCRVVFSQFSTEYNKLHKKKRGDWVFKCYLWYLRFSSFWKRGRAALPDPFQGWSRSHYSIWLHHITSFPGGEKSRIPFSCFRHTVSSDHSLQSAMGASWGLGHHSQAAICTQASSGHPHHIGSSLFLCPETELLQRPLDSHLQPTVPDTESSAF